MIARLGRALVAPRQAFAFSDANPGRAATDTFLVLLLFFLVTRPRAWVEGFYFVKGGEFGLGLMSLFTGLSDSFREPLFFLICGFLALGVTGFRKRSFWAHFDRACVALIPLIAVQLAGHCFLYLQLVTPQQLYPALTIAGMVWSGLWLLIATLDARKRAPGEGTNLERGRFRAGFAGMLLLSLWLAVGIQSGMRVAKNLHLFQPMVADTPAPAFVLRTIEKNGRLGGEVSLSSYRGKIVLLDFWATWCRPCEQAMPTLLRFANDYRAKGVEMISIHTETVDAAPQARVMADRLIPGIPLLSDEFARVSEAYRATTLPFLVIVDQNGRVAMVHRGFPGGNELYRMLAEAVSPLVDDGKRKHR
jgi:thiol-disulfide isomerase/thioredoxin